MPVLKEFGVFDTETNGVDTETCRIVTAFIGVMNAEGQMIERWSWLLDIGEDMPQGAIDVHGITNERMRAEGTPAPEGIFEIAQRLDILDRKGLPIVAMNARFDFTLLDREMRRHWPNIRTFEPRYVIDPYVLDKGLDKYRKGKRKLVNLAEHYGVEVRADAHDAEGDCIMAGQVALKIMEHPRVAPLTLAELHKKTIATARDQAISLAEYFRKESFKLTHPADKRAEFAKSADSIQAAWPIVPFTNPKEATDV